MAELLDYCSVTGMMQVMEKDGNKIHVKTTQDVEPMLNANQSDITLQQNGWKGDLHKVASIPLIVMEKWWKELGDNPMLPRNRKWLAAKLNSNEFLKLRTKNGRI